MPQIVLGNSGSMPKWLHLNGYDNICIVQCFDFSGVFPLHVWKSGSWRKQSRNPCDVKFIVGRLFEIQLSVSDHLLDLSVAALHPGHTLSPSKSCDDRAAKICIVYLILMSILPQIPNPSRVLLVHACVKVTPDL